MKELIINKASDLFAVKNRNTYTKLILNCEIKPKLLFGFNNIKELIINSESVEKNHLNEVTLNKLPFINNLEKLTFNNIEMFGKKPTKRTKNCFYPDYKYYKINAPNLKSIIFKYDKKTSYSNIVIENHYLEECNSLKEITFNSSKNIGIDGNIIIPQSLEDICLQFLGKEYFIKPNNVKTHFNFLSFDEYSKAISITYSSNLIKFNHNIEIITDKLKEKIELKKLTDDLIKNNTLYIPDYITYIKYEDKNYLNKIEHISFNINLLKSNNEFILTDTRYLNILKTIEIRTNKEMSLFPNIIIDIKNYGVINDLYIKDNKLYIIFNEYMLVVNETGVISKEEIKEEPIKDIEPTKNILDDYSISELEEYLQFRKLLEIYKDNNDQELNNALNIVKDRIIKKLTK